MGCAPQNERKRQIKTNKEGNEVGLVKSAEEKRWIKLGFGKSDGVWHKV